MSSISSVSSPTNYYPTSAQNSVNQTIQDFQAIGNALQSGNLSSAQTALATFQQDLQSNSQSSTNQPFGNNNAANTDYQNLVGALQSNNLSAAQKAFSSLQTDLKGTQKGHRHHGHHGGGSSTESTQSTPSTQSPQSTQTNSTDTSSDSDSDGGDDESLLNALA